MITYTRLYSDAHGESHFDTTGKGHSSRVVSATGSLAAMVQLSD